jgi:hypothetical protein
VVGLVFKLTLVAGGLDSGDSLVVMSFRSLRLAMLLASAVVEIGTGARVIVTFDLGLLSSSFLASASGLVFEGEGRGEFGSWEECDRGGMRWDVCWRL